MNQIAIVDDLAARRTAAARKAWETRRAQGWTHGGAHNSSPASAKQEKSVAAEALAAFEREAASDAPDWHSAALLLKQALGQQKSPVIRQDSPKPAAPPPSRWHDYPVDRVGSFSIRTDVLVITFADGEVIRAPAVSVKGKPTNIGRGLRITIAFYQARIAKRSGLQFAPGFLAAVPAIASCVCEDSGETFDAEECTVRTSENRKAQDWRIRR
jgi:hypothetical protein